MDNDKAKYASPLATRLMRAAGKLLGSGEELVVATDLGLETYDPRRSTSGDSAKMRQMRRAKSRASSIAGAIDWSRRARYNDFREMGAEVPELGTSLDVMCNFVFGGDSGAGANDDDGPRVVFREGTSDAVRSVVEQAATELDLNAFMLAVFREGMQFGDSFTEMVFTRDSLVDQKPLVSDSTDVVWDDYGSLKGYRYAPSRSYGTPTAMGGILLAPWQVLHYAPDRPRGHKYGRSNWFSARKLWRISQASLDVLSILAILRASARKSVALPVPAGIKEDEVLDFVEKLKSGAWRDDFFDSDGVLRHRIASMLELDDIIYPYRQGTEKPTFHNEPSADITQLTDLQKYLQESYFVSTGVPAALCGLERNVNARSTLEQQGLHFVRTVRRRQIEIARIAMDVLVRACLVKGIRPSAGDFRYVMPTVNTFDLKLRAEVTRIRAESAKILSVDMGVDLRWVYTRVLGMSEREATDAIQGRYEADAAEGISVDSASPLRGGVSSLRHAHEIAEYAQVLRERVEEERASLAGAR